MSGDVWNGTFVKREFKDHFKIIKVEKDEIFDIYHVTVQFYKTPEKNYVFDIDAEDFENNKDAVAKEILRQLSND